MPSSSPSHIVKSLVMNRRSALLLGLVSVPAVGVLSMTGSAQADTSPAISVLDAVVVQKGPMAPVVGTPGTYRPDETTTGWRPVRASLTSHAGDILITKPGTVIEGLFITGRVLVRAANVTIRQCEIVGNGYAGGNTGLVDCNHPAAANVVIEDCELHQGVETANVWHDGVIGHDYTARRNLVYDTVDGFGAYNSYSPGQPANVVIEANYVRELSYFSPDPNHSDNRTHNDGIQIQGNGGIQILGNHIRGYASSTVGTGPQNDPYFPLITGHVVTCTPTVSAITGITVENNWFYGGVCGFIAIAGSKGASNLGTITNNRFGTDMRLKTPIQLDNTLTGTFSNNVWDNDAATTSAAYYKPGTI
ncbi:hypothetical protein [Nakamurella sp. PAMC28650]|uniref:hypothetical protein n=1 Tax=Nakamurella sp. PAMC28650 TaxID=2762325 RepID=UPI00164D8105|nr:hypothetical protein [Nakamurella sp. PAMC28650]QNK80966.1 hypothetical protein H7F38_23265 [Nakamurella sp. PAMC28650]